MDKQDEILSFLRTVEQADKKQIYENVKFTYYHNWAKYLGEIISRMVKNGKVERVKSGLYKIKGKQESNMPELF